MVRDIHIAPIARCYALYTPLIISQMLWRGVSKGALHLKNWKYKGTDEAYTLNSKYFCFVELEMIVTAIENPASL